MTKLGILNRFIVLSPANFSLFTLLKAHRCSKIS